MSWEYYIEEHTAIEVAVEDLVKDLIERYDLSNKSRVREFTYKRQYLMHVMKSKTNRSLQYIGSMFNRDHATVIHSCNNVESLMDVKDKLFYDITEPLRDVIDAHSFSDVREDKKRVVQLSSIIPFDTYKKLIKLKDKEHSTISEIIRRGLSMVFTEEEIQKKVV